ncbi:hypothetical protein D3C75_224480 [compost metagenome]
MEQVVMFIIWVVCGVWMWRCVGRPPKQCLQCIVTRYIILIVALLIASALL